MSNTSKVTLTNGVEMPALGVGDYQIPRGHRGGIAFLRLTSRRQA
jgi:diketogulonate reductase-like aldo/keto reductase